MSKMKKSSSSKIKWVLCSVLLLGLAINIAAWNIIVPAEFGIAVGLVFILPSSLMLTGAFIFIAKSKFDKKDTFTQCIVLTLLALIIPALLSVVVVRDINRRIMLLKDPEMKAFLDFTNKDIPPIQNGLWYYPNTGNPSAILNFIDGKSHGEHKFFHYETNELEEVKFYNNGKLDSIYNYSQNKLDISYHFHSAQEKIDVTKHYYYDNNNSQINRVIIFHTGSSKKDTILFSDLN